MVLSKQLVQHQVIFRQQVTLTFFCSLTPPPPPRPFDILTNLVLIMVFSYGFEYYFVIFGKMVPIRFRHIIYYHIFITISLGQSFAGLWALDRNLAPSPTQGLIAKIRYSPLSGLIFGLKQDLRKG